MLTDNLITSFNNAELRRILFEGDWPVDVVDRVMNAIHTEWPQFNQRTRIELTGYHSVEVVTNTCRLTVVLREYGYANGYTRYYVWLGYCGHNDTLYCRGVRAHNIALWGVNFDA